VIYTAYFNLKRQRYAPAPATVSSDRLRESILIASFCHRAVGGSHAVL
jgi:hypothetical protein